MVLITLIIMNLIWVGYSLTEGIREGFYWHYENISKKVCDFDINPVFNLQRALVLLISGGFMVQILGWYSLLSLLSMILMFSFFHNGTYYYTRNKLSGKIYEKGWKDESRTFPPFTPLMTYNKRTLAMGIGILAQVFIYLFLLN
jgi:hypothetical protein